MKQATFWNLITAVAVVVIGIIGLIVITELELRPMNKEYWTPNKVLYPDQSEDRIPGDTRFMGLPPAPHCGHLHDHPGKHKLWAECMGAGYNGSKIDALLYSDRGDDAPDCTKVPIRGRNHEWVDYCTGRRGD